MRVLRLAPRWKLLLAAAASASLAVLVSGALASPSDPAAAVPTFQLVTAPKCASGTTRLGRACVDRPKIPEWTINDGSASWNHTSGVGGLWLTTYTWRIPTTVPRAGATVTLTLTAKENTNNPNSRICPAIGVSGGFLVKAPSQVGKCAEGGGSANANLAVKVVTPSASAGSTVSLRVGVQDGPIYTYTYRAVAAQKKREKDPPRCPKPRRTSTASPQTAGVATRRDGRPAGASAACEVTVSFALLHGGWPKGKPKGFIDVTTNAIGVVSFDFDSTKLNQNYFRTPLIEPNDITVRIVRTIHIIEEVPTPTPKKARLVFRARPGGLIQYEEQNFNPDKPVARLSVPLVLVSSNDPDCDAGTRAVLDVEEDPPIDEFNLAIPCLVHHGTFSSGDKGRKPLVRVAISRK